MINVFNAVLNYNIVLPVLHRMYVINVTTILLILSMEHVHNAEPVTHRDLLLLSRAGNKALLCQGREFFRFKVYN